MKAIRSDARFTTARAQWRRRLYLFEIGFDAARTGMARRLRDAIAEIAANDLRKAAELTIYITPQLVLS